MTLCSSAARLSRLPAGDTLCPQARAPGYRRPCSGRERKNRFSWLHRCRELSNANVLTVAFRAFLSRHDLWLPHRRRRKPLALQTELRMSADHQASQGAVRGPEGMPITLDDLPPPGTKRWVIRRKAEVVAGVRAGLLSLEEACQRYTLSVEEFLSWQRLIDKHGLRGLRVTRLQDYRGAGAADEAR